MEASRIERLAYFLWQQRGMPLGTPDQDWFLAEELVRGQYVRCELSPHEMPLFAFGIERRTR